MSEESALTVTGGVAGTRAVMEDLDHAARVLDGACGHLAEAARALRQARASVSSALVSAPATMTAELWSLHDQVSTAVTGPSGADTVQSACEDAARRLHDVADVYVQAEQDAHSSAPAVADAGGWSTLLRGRLVAEVWTAQALGWASVMGRLGWVTSPGPPPTTPWVNRDTVSAALAATDRQVGDLPTVFDAVTTMLAARLAVIEWLVNEPKSRRVYRVGQVEPATPPAGVEDLLAAVADLPHGDGGAIGVDRIGSGDGTDAYVVRIPGTADWGVSGPHPFDLQANLVSINGGASDAAVAVVAAMEAAEIPPDVPVMLVGHSQGGMIATTLAAVPAVRERFAVTHVVTAGAPVSRLDHHQDVQYLHVQHEQDLVPGLSARDNPDGANVVTVSSAVAGGLTMAAAHAVSGYAVTGAQLDRSSRASVVAWRDSAGAFTSGTGATRQVFRPSTRAQAQDQAASPAPR